MRTMADFEISDEIPNIVWAHNSHIGNSNATGRGGKHLQKTIHGTGQMAKEIFPNTCGMSFYTNTGTLTAGKGKNETTIQDINKVNVIHMNIYSV